MSCCRYCGQIARLDGAGGKTLSTDHHPSISALKESAKDCALCKTFILWLGDRKVQEASQAEAEGELRHIKVNVQKILTDEQHLSRAVSRRVLEIKSKSTSWETPAFHMCTSKGRMADRAVWASSDEVTFVKRVPSVLKLLDECDSTHSGCKASFLPSGSGPARLIDVGSENKSLRLVATSALDTSGSGVQYLALTHCWGSRVPLRTTARTLAEFTDCLPVARLPRVYAEAVIATRSLGMRFIWIDSLCIVQDDKADFFREAAKMASIFQHAFLTISAVSAKDCHGSLGVSLSQSPALQFDLKPVAGIPESSSGVPESAKIPRLYVHSQRQSEWGIVFAPSPQKQRGWIFQEIFLSRRILNLMDGQFIWQCRTCVESEDGTYRQDVGGNPLLSFRHDRGLMQVLNLRDENVSRKIWWTWMAECWRRKFAYPRDSWPAIIGITKLYQQVTGDEPVVGLWQSGLPSELAWCIQHRNAPSRKRDLGMPSWSWASIPHEFRRHIDTSFIAPANRTVAYNQHQIFWQAQVTDIDVHWTGEPLVPPLHRASITIRGTLQRVNWRLGERRKVWGSTFRSREGHLNVCFDVRRLLPQEADVLLIYAGWKTSPTHERTRGEKQVSYCYLIVEAVSEEGNTPKNYRRVGLVYFLTHMDELPGDMELEGEAPEVIRLV